MFDSVLLLIKLYGGFYILFGIALIFSANSIPIPFDDSLGIGSLNKSDLLVVTSEVVYIVLSLGGFISSSCGVTLSVQLNRFFFI